MAKTTYEQRMIAAAKKTRQAQIKTIQSTIKKCQARAKSIDKQGRTLAAKAKPLQVKLRSAKTQAQVLSIQAKLQQGSNRFQALRRDYESAMQNLNYWKSELERLKRQPLF